MDETYSFDELINRVIVVICRLYFMTIMRGRSRPVHQRRLKDLAEKHGLEAKHIQPAFDTLEMIRKHENFELWITDHAYFMQKCYHNGEAFMVQIIEEIDYSPIDACAYSLMAQFTKTFRNTSAKDNVEHFGRQLTGLTIESNHDLNVYILLAIHDNPLTGLDAIPRDKYDALLTRKQRRIESPLPNKRAAYESTASAISKEMLLAVPEKTAPYRTHPTESISGKLLQPGLRPGPLNLGQLSGWGRKSEALELEQTVAPATTLKQLGSTSGASSIPPIAYETTKHLITGAPASSCFIFGDHVAIPCTGISSCIHFQNIAAQLKPLENISRTIINGQHYLLPAKDLATIYSIVVPRPGIKVSGLPKITINGAMSSSVTVKP